MGPVVPNEASRLLDDDILSPVAEANQLAGRIHPTLQGSIGDLVRSMNCYYSNLIEGHDTHPHDVDRAPANDFSTEPEKRDLQREVVAHIHVQRLIDSGHRSRCLAGISSLCVVAAWRVLLAAAVGNAVCY